MTRPTPKRRHSTEPISMPQLRPIVMALFAAFPALASAQARVAPPPPPSFRVPVPVSVPGWRVSGTGAAAPVNTTNRAGGTDQVVNQTSQSAIYNWQSFDIGSASSVTFNFPSAAGSALNRITGSTSPSQILGRLTSQYANPTAGGSPLVGGSIYLINANGILFGGSAVVNTGALIASTLNLTDADFNSGLTNSITSATPSFFKDGPGVPDSNNFVQVDTGAQITTPEGGRVFLFAKNVSNAGTITTPGGQTALAAGDQVYLNVPNAEVMYASEVNPSIPSLRGLLVEVGTGSGSVANVAGGVIDTPRGNTTLVGMAVNQSGRISATTSVAENGSVMLLARGDAVAATDPTSSTLVKRATVTGTLTLGSGSSIRIDPDMTPGADGKPATTDGNSAFTASRIELDGQTVQLQSGASIVAHGGIVNIRSESTPFYEEAASSVLPYNFAAFDGNTNARLVIGDGVDIDVSGTTSATVSAARNFVTTQRLGATDLKDAPLQKGGVVDRSIITFDVREAVPILGDTSTYKTGIERTAEEQLSHGGTINLSSTGAVVTNENSTLNVSGGQVNYTAAMVTPSQLVGKDGKIYSFNDAPADAVYTSIIGASPAPTYDRWGIVPQYLPAQTVKGQLAQGYVDGQAGGTLNVVAPVTVLDGHVQAQTTAGVRQTSGQDPMAAPGRVMLGSRSNGSSSFGSSDYVTSGLGDIAIAKDPGSLGSGFWTDPLNRALPDASRIAASTLNESGLGQFFVTSDGNIAQQIGADLSLQPGAVVDLAAGGASGITINANFNSAGGTFNAETRDVPASAAHPAAPSGGVTLEAGSSIDVAGAWVNRALDGATATAATSGGSVTLSSGRGLDVQDATRIDVSGGATVGVDGSVAGTAAGSITLQSDVIRSQDTDPASLIHIGAALVGDSLNGGGKLSLSADSIVIGSQPLPLGIKDGQAPGSLVLSSQFFDNGAFTTYDVSAIRSLVVQPGVTLQPKASNWILSAEAGNEPSGSQPSSFMTQGTLPDSQRKPVNLSLSAASRVGNAFGDLSIGAGASIVTDPSASVSLSAGLNLDVNGRIVAHGGDVSLNLVGAAQSSAPATGSLTLGANAVVDVSGTTVLQPQTGLLPTGQVLAGGDVTIGVSRSAALTPIVLQQGSVIDADGAFDMLGVTSTTAGGGTAIVQQSVASEGGSVSIASQNGGALLAGTMHANGGDKTVSGGAFNLSQISAATDTSTIVVQQAPVTARAAVANSVMVSATDLAQGFSDASLQSQNVIRFSGDVSLGMAGNLVLDAPVLSASPQSRNVSLSAGSTLQTGSSYQQILSPAAAIGGGTQIAFNGGLVELFGQQVLQGVGSVELASTSELRLQSTTGAGPVQGDFGVQGDLTIDAPQIAPTTNTQFTIDAPGQRVLMTGGDRSAAVPLTAGGSVTINARDITTLDPGDPSGYAVLRAPFGTLTLNATDRIDIGAGTLLSVSGAGLTVPFGTTADGKTWTYDGVPLTAPPQKTINLNAPGQAVNVAAGSTLDLSGGGDLLALDFVPGVGGSKDVFAGAAGGAFAILPGSSAYAPHDADLLTLTDAAGQQASAALGRDITFGAGGPVPAGTYVVLPARYAVLPGAYLVTPTAWSAPLALGAVVPQQDGSTLVGGRYSEAGTSFGSSLPQTFRVASSVLALTHSEIDKTNANAFFSASAAAAGTSVPALPTDAGRLNIASDQLTLKGTTDFALPQTKDASGNMVSVGRGGELDIAASNIQVSGSSGAQDVQQAGVLSLSASDLNATGASLVILGGRRGGDSGNAVDVTASSVVVDNAGTPLKLNDLVLVATGNVELKAGSDIEAPAASSTSSAAAPTLGLSGDGALLRVSTDAGATSVRTGAQRTMGTLLIGSGATLAGGAITAEATQGSTLASDASFHANAITLGADRIAIGDPGTAVVDPGTLTITPSLIAQVGSAQSLTLRSFDGLDLYGSTTLGSASVHSLTLDTGLIRLIGDGASSSIEAGGVRLTNTSGSSSVATPGSGRLQIKASAADASAGTGQVVIGPGSLAVSGANSLTVDAAHEVVLGDQSNIASAGDITINAAALQAAKGATATISAGGAFTLASNSVAAAPGAGLGAHVEIDAASIEQAGQLLLPSGQLTLNAIGTGGAASNAIHFASGSLTDLSGRSSTFDNVTVSTGGGALALNAPSAGIALDAGSTLDVSGAATGGPAGSITISAPTGTVALQGALRATAAAGQTGGSLSVDSGTALDLAALSATINATPANFGESIDLRNRIGDETLAAGGAGFTARSISISADTGVLSIAGKLNASGASGATVTLAGGAGLNIDAGADIGAHSNGSVGGQVQLLSGNLEAQADGSFAGSNGPVQFNGGTIDTSAASGGVDGSLLVRAQRNAAGTDVMIAGSGQTQVHGASQIEVEAVRQYAASTVNTALITKINTDDATLGGSNGANAATLNSRLDSLLGQAAGTTQLRAGVEVDSTGDLAVVGNPTNGGWNLTQFAANGTAIAQSTGAPIDLTLRAQGNLNVSASISDGFIPSGNVPTTAAAASKIVAASTIANIGGSPAEGARIRLIGGADASAASVMATSASQDGGDVVIGAAGKSVLVRSTTGDIDIAAGRDVVLLNSLAAVYTTGTPVATLDGYVGNRLPAAAYLRSGTTSQTPFLSGGGSLSVSAARDIVGVDPSTAPQQYATEWAWRAMDLGSGNSSATAQPMWWNRYDQFQQGFATFGGGNVTASAQRDIVNGDFSAASSGYVARDAAGNAAGVRQFGGGDLSVQAGRDVVAGFVLAAGANGNVQAGRDITASTDEGSYALQVLHGNTDVRIGALDNIDLGNVTSFGLVQATKEYTTAPLNFYITGLAPQATLDVVADSGNLNYRASAPSDNNGPTALPRSSDASAVQDRIIPDTSTFAAPSGNVDLGTLLQMPAGTTSLNVLAEGDLHAAGITVTRTDPRAATASTITDVDSGSLNQLTGTVIPNLTPIDSGTRSPMRLVAQDGDVVVSTGILTTTPLRVIAGRDISFGPGSSANAFAGITFQHQSDSELSLLEAGRDILFPDSGRPVGADLQFYGPGNLLVLAGRNIDLSTSGGIEALGNRQNALLPAVSGTVTALAGVTLGPDYSQAVAWYFPLLGGTGIAGHAADLVAQLAALQAGQPLPAPGSDAAAQFGKLAIADQIAQTKTLVGEATFDAAVLADARRRDGDAAVTLTQAMAEYAKLDASAQYTVVSAALANAWSAAVPQAMQQQQVLAMAGLSGSNAYLTALQQFVVSQGGAPSLTPDQALSAFSALAPERQLLFTNQVLVSEIRKAGRTASALTGSDRDAAYAPAYAAIDVVFPDTGATGDVSMGSSQIHSLQDSDLVLMAPHGNVDVGTLTAGAHQKPANALGIVTSDGGNISVVVQGDVNVNQSRVFTVGKGDLLMWASDGNLDAGRGAKTVTGVPAPVFSLDASGHFIIDTSGSFSGSGIAVLDASSTLDLYAPKGEINAGDAGIKSLGNAFLGAARFVGADNLSVAGVAVGAPPPATTGGDTAGMALVAQAATSAGPRINSDDSDDDKDRKRRRRLNLILDFLGFGDGSSKQP